MASVTHPEWPDAKHPEWPDAKHPEWPDAKHPEWPDDTTHYEPEPLDDVMIEKILHMGEFINDNSARLGRSKILKVKCDKCFTVGIPASFRWNGFDICLLCAHKHKSRAMAIEQDSKVEYLPAHEAESKVKLQKILNTFIEQKVSSSDEHFVPTLVHIAFSTLRHALPDAFWEYADQNTINTFDGFMDRMRNRFVDTFGREFLAKVYNIEYNKHNKDHIDIGEE